MGRDKHWRIIGFEERLEFGGQFDEAVADVVWLVAQGDFDVGAEHCVFMFMDPLRLNDFGVDL